MQVNTILNYHFTAVGTALVNSVSKPCDTLRDGVIRPHEFVFIYQEKDVDYAKWTDLVETIRNRLLVCGNEFAVLYLQQNQEQKKIAVVHKDAHRIVQSLAYEGVVCEFNLQHIFEFGFAPVLLHYIDLLNTLKLS